MDPEPLRFKESRLRLCLRLPALDLLSCLRLPQLSSLSELFSSLVFEFFPFPPLVSELSPPPSCPLLLSRFLTRNSLASENNLTA